MRGHTDSQGVSGIGTVWRELPILLLLLLPPFLLLWAMTLGPYTLLPVDNLFTAPPFSSFARELGVGQPHNALLSDLILENYTWKQFIINSIRNRELPLWDPHLFAGHPFLANGQHSALYPLSLVFLAMPLAKAYGWFTLLQLWLAGVFLYAYLRVVRVRPFGSLVGACVFQISTFFVVSVVFTMIIAAAVWLPLLLALIEIVVRKQEQKGLAKYSPAPFIAAGAVVLGIQVFAGHIEITYYTLLVAGLYALCRLLVLWRRLHAWQPAARLALWLAGMFALGMGLGAAQFVPLYEVASRNFRVGSVTYSDVVGWALPARRIVSFLIPDFFGNPSHHTTFDLVTRQWLPVGLNAHGAVNPLCPNCTAWDTKTSVEAGAYLGILPLALAGLALVAWFEARRRHQELLGGTQVWIFGLLAASSLLFAFGTPLYALLYYGLPFWNQLHSPFRWIYPFTLAVSVLAGLGAEYLARFVKPLGDRPQRDEEAGDHLPRLQNTSLRVAWLAVWTGVAGLVVLALAMVVPAPFFHVAQMVLDRSGLAQNAFADGRQFFGYLWPAFAKFFLFLLAAGAVLRICRCPIYLPRPLPPMPAWQPLAVVVIVADLLVAGRGFNPQADPALLGFEPPVVRWLLEQRESDPFFRITSFDVPGEPHPLIANTAMHYGLQDTRGYDSIIPGQYAAFMARIQPQGDLLYNRIAPIYHPGYAALDSALLDLLGARYVLTTVDIPNEGYKLVYDQEIRVYENLDVMPRAFVVPVAQQVSDADMDFELRSLNPRCKVILEAGAEGVPDNHPGSGPAESCPLHPATVTSYGNNELSLAASIDEPSWLVVADSYFPGWKAYARPASSGEDSPESELTIFRADGNFRAVHLQPGDWTVRFKYAPMSFKLGLYGSFLAGIVTLLLAGVWAWGKVYRESEDDLPIKRIAKNSLVPMALALMNRLIDFAFALLMLRILSPEGAGRFQFAVVFIGYAEIFTRFGLGTLLTREVARDRAQSNGLFSNITILRVWLWLASIPLMGVVLWLYVLFGGVAIETVIAVGLFAVGLFLSNISDGLTALFYGHEKAEYPAAIATVTTVIRVGLGALILLLGGGVIGLAGVSVVANAASVLILGSLLSRKVFRPWVESDGPLRRRMMAESLPLMINHLLATIFFRIDILILQPTWGDRAVGFYGAAYKYIDGINIIPSYFTLAIFPLMSRYAQTARDSLARAYVLSLRLLMMVALPISVGTPFVARQLILILGGAEYLPDSMIALQLLIWFLPFSFVNQVTQYVLIAIDQQRFLTRAFLIGVVFNVAANLLLIPRFGYRAAAVTTILSEWALLIPFYYAVRKNLCHVPWISVLWRPALAAGVMGATLWLFGDLHIVVLILLAILVYFGILFLCGGFRQPDMELIWRVLPLDKLRSRVSRG